MLLDSVVAVFERARAHVPKAELSGLVMSDPGTGDYVAAYERVLELGVPALLEEVGGVPRLGSFDIGENLLLSHHSAGESVCHRWFSVLTACIELLGASAYRHTPLPVTLAGLFVDGFALDAAQVRSGPLDLLPLVCRDLQRTRTDDHERAIALLGELISARPSDAEAEAKCRELLTMHDGFQSWYREDGEPNPFFARRPELLWGALRLDRRTQATWVELVAQHFPASPGLPRDTRERLLREGAFQRQS